MTEYSVFAIFVFLAVSGYVYVVWARRVRSGFYEELGPRSSMGLEPGERVVGAWQCERYFGPLVPGSERTLGSWI